MWLAFGVVAKIFLFALIEEIYILFAQKQVAKKTKNPKNFAKVQDRHKT
jgi:hypothetical protein